MEILFNSKFLNHNPGSSAEGPYRIEAFQSQVREVDSNGEAYVTLVHSESHLKMVRDACMKHQVLAEVSLTPESYEAACSAVGLTIMAAEQGDFAVVRPPRLPRGLGPSPPPPGSSPGGGVGVVAVASFLAATAAK